MQVQVIQKPLKYGARRNPYAIGDMIEMTVKHARLFMAIGRVGLPKPPRPDIPASPSLPVVLVEEQAIVPAERPRRQYRRRDMKVED